MKIELEESCEETMVIELTGMVYLIGPNERLNSQHLNQKASTSYPQNIKYFGVDQNIPLIYIYTYLLF